MSGGEVRLFEPVLTVSEPALYGQIPGFAIGMGSTSGAPDVYTHGVVPSFFFPQEGSGLEAGITDMVTDIALASGTGRRGLLNPSEDAGGSTTGTTAMFMIRYLYSQGETFEIGYLLPDPDNCDADYVHGTSSPDLGIILLGGNHTQAFCGQFPLNSTTGDQSVTGVGFQPDVVVFLSCSVVQTAGGPFPAGGGGSDGTQFMLGAIDGNGNQWVGCTRSTIITNPMVRMSNWYDDNCIAHIGSGEFGFPTQSQLASYVSMDSDGFTINLSQAGLAGPSVNLDMNVGFLALKAGAGCAFEVGNGVQSDGSVSTSFAPDAMLFASTQNPTSGSQRSDCFMSMGLVGDDVATSTLNRNVWQGTNSGAPLDGSDTDSLAYYSTVSALRFADCVGGGQLLAEADATLTGSGATLNWTTDDSNARLFGWLAMKTDGDPCRRSVVQVMRWH